MTKILKKNYEIKTGKVEKRIVLLTDIHYYCSKNKNKLNKILEVLKNDKYDYLCIVGDLIDVGIVKDIDIFINWIKELSLLSPVFISLGGHDLISNSKQIEYYYNELLFDEIKKISNVYILDNKAHCVGNIRFIGLTMPIDFYYKYKENVNYFRRYVNNTFSAFSGKYNILLSHTPIPLTRLENYEEIKVMKNVSLVLSGHTHAGIVPNFLRKTLKGKGIFAPSGLKMFPNDCYGMITKGDVKIIISSGVTKASHSNPFSFVDCFFDTEITYIDLKK